MTPATLWTPAAASSCSPESALGRSTCTSWRRRWESLHLVRAKASSSSQFHCIKHQPKLWDYTHLDPTKAVGSPDLWMCLSLHHCGPSLCTDVLRLSPFYVDIPHTYKHQSLAYQILHLFTGVPVAGLMTATDLDYLVKNDSKDHCMILSLLSKDS